MCNFQWISLLFTFGLFAFMTNAVSCTNMDEENVPLHLSEAVQGSEGRLPCNVTPPIGGDKVVLVIWYKDGLATPIYSFDSRDLKFEYGKHWYDEMSLGTRAFFEASTEPALLTIRNITNAENGVYRCRVDFHKSPTRNSRVQLNVIVPPEKLLVLDEKGSHVQHYILGPYNEGSSVNITCVSTGGRPLPTLTWWHGGTQLNGTSTILSEQRVKNVLRLEKLKRKNLHMEIVCQASNNNITTPQSVLMTVDLNLRPLGVKLHGENRPLSADHPYDLRCEVVGARPTPSITWWKGSTQMRNQRELISADGNTTTSILSFTPTIDDRGKFLSCRAEQSLIPESGIESGWKLDIYHIPVVALEFGTNLNTTSIREGADVYFECNIKSNPWIYKVSWRHNGIILDNNIAEGITVANQSLVLQNVSKARSGLYTCVGSNREGNGESNPVHLDIKFGPLCRPGQNTIYSAGRQEMAKISCDLDANPSDVAFTWKFNATTYESIDIAASLVITDHAKSVVHYTPMTEHDYGTLLCWGANEIGSQAEPCIFTVKAAGNPDPLSNCTVSNQTSHTFQVDCIEGFDGGLEQSFVVELYPTGTNQLISSIKSKTPNFEMKGLDPGVGYDIVLAATNTMGHSKVTRIQAYTIKDPEKQTDFSLAYSPAIEHMKPFLGTLLGIVGALVLIALIIVIVVQMRGSSGRDRNNCPSHTRPQETITATTTTATATRNAQLFNDINREGCNESVDSIEKNPDVVPQENKNDDRDEDETAFEWLSTARPRLYATAVMAEQQNLIKTGQSYDNRNFPISNEAGALQQQSTQFPAQIPAHPNYYATIVPTTSLGYSNKLNAEALTYADLSISQQKPFFTSATLGRPRHTEFKRIEPTIYAQIDLAHHPQQQHHHPPHHAMYSTSSMYGGCSTNTGVVVSSHSSQMTAFPPPPLFANNSVTHNAPLPAANTSGCSNNTISKLPMVPEGNIIQNSIAMPLVSHSQQQHHQHHQPHAMVSPSTSLGDINVNNATRF